MKKYSSSWASFVFVFLSGIFLCISFFKVPPTMVMLMQEFGVGPGVAGWFMSICSLAGMIVAIPAGTLQAKIGPKNALLTALALSAVSNLIGALAPNLAIFMVARFVEGMGLGFISVAAPTIIASLFDYQKRGLPNAVWATWTAVGTLFVFNLVNVIVAKTGDWRPVWWFALVIMVVIFFVALVGIRVSKEKAEALAKEGAQVQLSKGFTAPQAINMMVLFTIFAFGFSVWAAFAPTYMQATSGMEMAQANSIASITTIAGIIGSIFIGFILNKTKNRPALQLVLFVLGGVVMSCELLFTGTNMMIIMAILVGFVLNMLPPTMFSNAPLSVPTPALIGAAMAMLAVGANLGGLLASSIVGAIVQSTGNWAMGSIPLVIVAVLGIVCAFVFYRACGRQSIQAAKADAVRAVGTAD